ncbi:hypothetical protein HNY73_007874 [Argiope bruennichi]|uniref:Uncharacterized protein n=1 Tax=Argiope bruennichi TaxID=94029 RepID=A0A8T0F6S8_ARGBR|nr:hypothetical protein HNY73_007874 [Argiope bruennichi]
MCPVVPSIDYGTIMKEIKTPVEDMALEAGELQHRQTITTFFNVPDAKTVRQLALKAGELSKKQGKRSLSPSPETTKKRKRSLQLSSPSEETNSKISATERSVGKFKCNDKLKNVLRDDKSLANFKSEDKCVINYPLNDCQTFFGKQVLNESEGSVYFLKSFERKNDFLTELCEDKWDPGRAPATLRKSFDGSFQDDYYDDSNSSFKTAASDLESDPALCSVSGTCDSFAKSLDNKSSSNQQVGITPCLESKYCEQIGSKTIEILDESSGQISDESFSHSHIDGCFNSGINRIHRLNFNEDLTYEMKPFSEKLNMAIERSKFQFHNITLETNNVLNYTSKNCFENKEKNQNNILSNWNKNYSENEKAQDILKNLNNSDCFQFGPKKFQSLDGSIWFPPEKELHSKMKEVSLISALTPKLQNSALISKMVPEYDDSQNECFLSCAIQSEGQSLYEKSGTKNEIQTYGKKFANICSTSHQQIDADPKIDGISFTSFHTREIGEEKSNLQNFLNFDSSNDSSLLGAEKIKKRNNDDKQEIETSSLYLTQSYGFPDLFKTRVKEPDISTTEGVSRSPSDCIISLISSETKYNLDKDKNYKHMQRIRGSDYEASEPNKLAISKSIKNVSKCKVVRNKFLNTTVEKDSGSFTAAKNNFKKVRSLKSREIKTDKKMDNVYLTASKSDLADNTGNENCIRKKTKFLQEIMGKQKREIVPYRNKLDNFTMKSREVRHDNLNSSMNITSTVNYKEGENLLASTNRNYHRNGGLVQNLHHSTESPNNSEKQPNRILLKLLSESSKIVKAVDNSVARKDILSPEELTKKREIIYSLDLRSVETKSKLLCNLSPELNSKESSLSNYTDNKNIINSDDNKSLKNRLSKSKKKCDRGSKSLQNTERKISETWEVKGAAINKTFEIGDKVIPPLILQRPQRILASNTKIPQTVSRIDVTNKKVMGQSNQNAEIRCKTILNLHNNTSENIPENDIKHLLINDLKFSSPQMDNVKRTFEVLGPRCRSVPLIQKRDWKHFPFNYKTDTASKTITEEINSVIRPISLLLKVRESKTNISNAAANSGGICSKSKQSLSSIEDEPWNEKSKDGSKAELRDTLSETNVRISTPRKAKMRALLLMKEILPKRRIGNNWKRERKIN